LRPGQLDRNGPRSSERVCAKSRAPALVRRVDVDQDATPPHLPHLVVDQPKRFVSRFENERASSTAIFEHAPTMGGDQQPMRNSALATPPRGLHRRRPDVPMQSASKWATLAPTHLYGFTCRLTRTLDHSKKARRHERQLDLGRGALLAKQKHAVELIRVAASHSAPVSTHQTHITLQGERVKRGNLRGVVVILPSRGPNFANTQCETVHHRISLSSGLHEPNAQHSPRRACQNRDS
jgi:hypothetical protein